MWYSLDKVCAYTRICILPILLFSCTLGNFGGNMKCFIIGIVHTVRWVKSIKFMQLSLCFMIFALLVAFGFLHLNALVNFRESYGASLYDKQVQCEYFIVGPGIKMPGRDFIKKFEQLYNKNNPYVLDGAQQRKIPPVIHLIWLGSKFPEAWARFRQSMIDYHPDWIHILWSDFPQDARTGRILKPDQIKSLIDEQSCSGQILVGDLNFFKIYNRFFFNKAKNYAEKADILRYEIVYTFGGIYADTDMECKRNFEPLLKYDFFAGMEEQRTHVSVCNGCFGASAKNPILYQCISSIGKYAMAASEHYRVLSTAGPIHLTKVLDNYEAIHDGLNIIFPMTFFAPTDKVARKESFVVHYYVGSWIGVTL